MSRELVELRAGGMKPTAGDIRCAALGHITRMTVWHLRPKWEKGLSTEKKLKVYGGDLLHRLYAASLYPV